MSGTDRVREKWTEQEFWLTAKGSFRMPDGTIVRKDRYGPVRPATKEMTPAEAGLRARRDDALREVFG